MFRTPHKTKMIFTLENWLSAFHVFVGVYTWKYPHEAPALMKYGEVIQSLAAKGGNWRYYDDNFRFLRQSQPSSFNWAVIHWDLWMSAQVMAEKRPPIPS